MDTKTRIALEQSIAKWEANAAVARPDDAKIHGKDCPLCEAFVRGTNEGLCRGCPVAMATGLALCYGTPYTEAADALSKWNETGGQEFRAFAHREVEFLKSLIR